MNFDLNILNKYYKDGLLEKQIHPFLPLTIWNYSQKVQFDDLWDDILIHCRGLVTDTEGKVIAKPFKKFFNLEENKHIPSLDFSIWEKVDGSLGILFFYDGEWHICTRGSFTSDQAVKAKEMLPKYNEEWKNHFNKKHTYLFEITYPENRICVNYGDEEELTLLGSVDTETGEEFAPDEIVNAWFPQPCRYLFILGDTFERLKSLNYDNEEGFVVHFSNGQKMKIKFENYLKLHKIVWSLTNRLLWEYLSQNKIEELLAIIPDEYYIIITKEIENFKNLYRCHELAYQHLFGARDKNWTRKEFAEYAKKFKEPQVLFKMFDERSYEETIWKILYPKTCERLLTK